MGLIEALSGGKNPSRREMETAVECGQRSAVTGSRPIHRSLRPQWLPVAVAHNAVIWFSFPYAREGQSTHSYAQSIPSSILINDLPWPKNVGKDLIRSNYSFARMSLDPIRDNPLHKQAVVEPESCSVFFLEITYGKRFRWKGGLGGAIFFVTIFITSRAQK